MQGTFANVAPSPAPAAPPSPAPPRVPPINFTQCFNDCLSEHGVPAAVAGVVAGLCGLAGPGGVPCAVAATLVGAGIAELCLFRCGVMGASMGIAGGPTSPGGDIIIEFASQAEPAAAAMSQQLAARGFSVTPAQLRENIRTVTDMSRQLGAMGVSPTAAQAAEFFMQRLQAQSNANRFGAL